MPDNTSDNSHSADQSPPASALSFEDAFLQLAGIAEQLEAGGLTLAEATARYEQGMRLVRHCNQLLDSAELEIDTLRESNQRTSVEPLDGALYEPPEYDEEPPEDEQEELPF